MNNYILRDFNLTIRPKEKIGIINIDNSDSNIFFNIIMGLVDDCRKKGIIQIDKIDVFKVDHILRRKKIGFLHDNVEVFEGTIRSNIDPEDEYTDEEIIKLFHYLDFWN